MKIIQNTSIKIKILGTVLGITIVLSTLIYLLIFFFSGKISNDISKEVKIEARKNLESLSKSIYKSCEVTDQVLTQYLQNKLNQYKKLIQSYGSINFSNEKVEWKATNQFSGEIINISIPKVNLGNSWIGKNENFDTKQKVVDDLNEEFFTFTIFQRMNDKGDMLRIATNVKKLDGKRAIGTYIPSINQDGNKNKVVASVISGSTYFGNAYVVNDYYQTIYEPLKDNSGNIIGMLYVGVSLKAANKLREMILSIKVGESGYAYVLGGSGARKGYYIISKDGARDGESLWEVKDSDGNLVIQDIINKATQLKDSQLDYIEYNWLNPGDDSPKNKIVALMYFKPFDWVIGVGLSQDDLEKTAILVNDSFNELYLYLAVTIFILVIIIYFISSFISGFIAKPIIESTKIMGLIAKGQINEAIKKLDSGVNE